MTEYIQAYYWWLKVILEFMHMYLFIAFALIISKL